MTNPTHKTVLAITASILAACGASAVEAPLSFLGSSAPPVDFHGFVSQGYIYNTGNNDYLGGDSSKGTFDFREYGVNASIAKGKWRLGGQFFGQKLGAYGDDKIKLDWASVDYQAAQWFGVRAGRVKMPRGLYNETLDLDSTRAFVLMPQSVYDARLRDFQASFDGGMIYGNIDLKKAGSLDYKAFGGHIPMSINSGASDYFNIDAPFQNLAISMDDAFGASLFWNTPLQGLRVGYSFSRFQQFSTIRHVVIPAANKDYMADKRADNYDRHLVSLEYMIGNWVFAAEGGADVVKQFNVGPVGKAPTVFLYPDNYYGYLSATWRANHWLELGGYYSYYHWNQGSVGTLQQFPILNQGDFALAARFDLTDNLIFKIEGHYMDGSGLVLDVPSHPQPPASRTDEWFMFTAKFTFTF